MKRLLAPLGVVAVIGGLILARHRRDPVEAYGEHGAEWIEHFDRLGALLVWRSNTGSFLDFLSNSDGPYPPALHILTLPFGIEAEAVVWTGLGWWILLAVGVALTARGLLPEEPSAAAAGATMALLIPAAHGAAARYYYDLPMTALLWLGVGLIVAVEKDWLAGLAGGACAGLAAVVKWTAIPFAGPMLLGAVLARTKGPTVGVIAAVALGAAAPSGGYLALSTHSWVEMMGTFGPNEDPMGSVGEAAARSLKADPKLQAPDRSDRSGGRLERLLWYGKSIVVAVLAPAGVLVLLGLLIVARGRELPWRKLAFLGVPIVGGHVAFVAFIVPPLDERFVMTLAPALGLFGAAAWCALEGRGRAIAGVASVAVLLGVAVDFHTGDDPSLDPQTTIMMDEPSAGLGLVGSWERRGWGRSDRRRPQPYQLREDVWAIVESVSAQRVGIIGAPLFDTFGDRWWWRYRARLGEVQGTWGRQGELDVVWLCGDGPPPSGPVDVVVAADTRVTSIDQPWCPVDGDWDPGLRVAAQPPHVGAVVWLPKGRRAKVVRP
ncbi:MAG: hypothetical protein GY898_29000 [Proteobacteria bacterium]|nr:hypothetical protein [Pseudomonadota bacterium]